MDSNFHICAYRGSVGAGLSNVDIAAVQDGQLTISNSHFVLPKPAVLMWAFGFGTNMSRMRLNTPKMRYVGLPSLVPINIGTTVPSPYNLVDFLEKNVMLDMIDEVAVEASQTDAGAQTMNAILALQFARKEIPAQPTFRIRASAAITCVAGTWVNGSMTLDQTIPRGTYAICRMAAIGTNLIAARLLFAGAGFRPGVIARNSVGAVPHPLMDGDSMGVFGTFDSINLPTLDAFSNGACTAQEIFLDLVRLQGPSSSGY